MSRHMERLTALRDRRRRLSRRRRPAAVALADCAPAASSESDGASGAAGAGTAEQELGGGRPESAEAALSARETRERRSPAGGTGGQPLTAKPVTSPDPSSTTEPHILATALALRLGALLGCGAGERERERGLARLDEACAGGGKPAAAT